MQKVMMKNYHLVIVMFGIPKIQTSKVFRIYTDETY